MKKSQFLELARKATDNEWSKINQNIFKTDNFLHQSRKGVRMTNYWDGLDKSIKRYIWRYKLTGFETAVLASNDFDPLLDGEAFMKDRHDPNLKTSGAKEIGNTNCDGGCGSTHCKNHGCLNGADDSIMKVEAEDIAPNVDNMELTPEEMNVFDSSDLNANKSRIGAIGFIIVFLCVVSIIYIYSKCS